jgi:hypothetical protein
MRTGKDPPFGHLRGNAGSRVGRDPFLRRGEASVEATLRPELT